MNGLVLRGLPALLLAGAATGSLALWPRPGLSLELAAVLLASTLSSIGGFAFSAICGVLLQPLGTEPVQAVRIMLVASIATQLLGLWVLRRALALRPLLPFLAGGLLTLPVGLQLLLHLPASHYRSALGLVLAGYGAWTLLRPDRQPAIGPRLGLLGDVVAGALGGLTGGLAAFPGAAVVPWCALRGWPKDRQRAVFQPFILAMQLAALTLLGAWAPAGVAASPKLLAYVPPALLGTLFGLRVFGRLSDRRFGLVVNLLLLVSGGAMLAGGR